MVEGQGPRDQFPAWALGETVASPISVSGIPWFGGLRQMFFVLSLCIVYCIVYRLYC